MLPDYQLRHIWSLRNEELPVALRTVLTILGAVRGVGGIDSWGADVEAPYHIVSDEDHEVSVIIEGPVASPRG